MSGLSGIAENLVEVESTLPCSVQLAGSHLSDHVVTTSHMLASKLPRCKLRLDPSGFRKQSRVFDVCFAQYKYIVRPLLPTFYIQHQSSQPFACSLSQILRPSAQQAQAHQHHGFRNAVVPSRTIPAKATGRQVSIKSRLQIHQGLEFYSGFSVAAVAQHVCFDTLGKLPRSAAFSWSGPRSKHQDDLSDFCYL